MFLTFHFLMVLVSFDLKIQITSVSFCVLCDNTRAWDFFQEELFELYLTYLSDHCIN